jgi:hypothetical protein
MQGTDCFGQEKNLSFTKVTKLKQHWEIWISKKI